MTPRKRNPDRLLLAIAIVSIASSVVFFMAFERLSSRAKADEERVRDALWLRDKAVAENLALEKKYCDGTWENGACRPSTCSELQRPRAMRYPGQNDPRDYLEVFMGALKRGDRRALECYFIDTNGVNDLSRHINAAKDFSYYVFPISSWTQGNIVTSWASDDHSKTHRIDISLRNVDSIWKIIDISDPDGILK